MNKPASFLRMSPVLAAVLVALIQTAVLGYMVESRASILRNGVDVRLKTVPIDPRDLLRGDYVTLGYAISTIDRSIIVGETPKTAGRQTMAVRLAPGADGLWSASQASFGSLPEQPGSVVARTLPFDYYPGAEGEVPETISVSYGIERYYVPEGEGRALEDARNAQALEVDARVSSAGKMQIRQIVLDGTPVYEEPLY